MGGLRYTARPPSRKIGQGLAATLTTILTLMTDDAILMVPGQEPFGKEAFAEASKGTGNIQKARLKL
jgi:ketosteroid isomerase-like protein